MSDDPAGATLFPLAASRLAGKPFTVSEYNHSAPNDYQAECIPQLASFAAAQAWDGVWVYSYAHDAAIWDDPIVTEVTPFDGFWPAEPYHREYYRRNTMQGYCQIVIAPIETPLANAGVDETFARQVSEFIEQYRHVLEALAEL